MNDMNQQMLDALLDSNKALVTSNESISDSVRANSETVKATNETVKELTVSVRELVTTERERVLKDKQQQEIHTHIHRNTHTHARTHQGLTASQGTVGRRTSTKIQSRMVLSAMCVRARARVLFPGPSPHPLTLSNPHSWSCGWRGLWYHFCVGRTGRHTRPQRSKSNGITYISPTQVTPSHFSLYRKVIFCLASPTTGTIQTVPRSARILCTRVSRLPSNF